MTWFSQLERRKALLITGIVLICVAALLVTARRFNVTLDIYWHIKTGIDWLTQGLSPLQDHYSYTFYGEAIKSQPYIFQVIVGWLVLQFGVETGLEIFRITGFLAVVGLLLAYLRQLRSPTFVYLLALPIVTVLLQQRAISRPELISYSFIVLAVMLYYRARERLTPSTMLPILLLVWAWSNYHSAVFAYVIFFGLFVDSAVSMLHRRAEPALWFRWLGWGIAVLVAGALNPGFKIPFLGMSSFSAQWKDLILEYASLPAKLAAVSFTVDVSVYALGVVAAATAVMAVYRRRFGLLIVTGVLTYTAIDMSRLVTPNGIALTCVFAWLLSEIYWDKHSSILPRWTQIAFGSAALLLFAVFLYSSVWFARGNMMLNRTFSTGFPEDVTDYMIRNKISGRIFNDYEDGGYLIYRLSPHSRVYIDGRTNILYPVEHAKRHIEAKLAPEPLLEEIEKYDINLALLNNTKHNFSLMRDVNRLGLDFVGFEHSLYRSENPNFPVLGTLFARPACWSNDFIPAVSEERQKAIQLLPERSPAIEFFQLLAGYSAASNKPDFLSGLEDVSGWNDFSLRFFGYRALELGLYDEAWKLFANVKKQEMADYLAVAVANIGLGNWNNAEVILDGATRINWAMPRRYELQILYHLLLQIRSHAGLKLFDETYLESLAQQFGEGGEMHRTPGVGSFCPGN